MKISRDKNVITIVVEGKYDATDLQSVLTYYNDSAMWHSCGYCGASVPVGPEDHTENCLVRLLMEAEQSLEKTA
jgi:hypothetical protein